MKLSQCADGIVLAAALLVAAGCGGSQATEPATPTGTESEPVTEATPGEAAAPKKFDDMAPAERLKFMKEVIAPTMAKKFQELNAEHYAEFSCVTCHEIGRAHV